MQFLWSFASTVVLMGVMPVLWIGPIAGTLLSRKWWVAPVLGFVNATAVFVIVVATSHSPKFGEAGGEILAVYLVSGTLAGLFAAGIGSVLRKRKIAISRLSPH